MEYPISFYYIGNCLPEYVFSEFNIKKKKHNWNGTFFLFGVTNEV